METLEITVLIGFAILAAYLMWIHYRLIHRDFANDVYYAINSGILPIRDGVNKLLDDIVEEVEGRGSEINAKIAEQNEFLNEQKRLLNEQTNTMKEYKIAISGIIETLQDENDNLKKELIAKQEILDRLKKKAGG